MRRRSVLLLLVPAILILLRPVDSATAEDRWRNLYEKSQPGIASLEAEEVAAAVTGSSKPWMVQFYSSWCGHCRRFRPTFAQFGEEVQGWNDAVGVGAINCASDANVQTCRNYEIGSYPSVKFFPPNASSKELGKLVQGLQTVPGLLTATADWIEEMQAAPDNLRRRYFSGVPLLTGLATADPKELWADDDKADEAVVIFSRRVEGFNVGEIALDLHAASSSKAASVVRKIEAEANEAPFLFNVGLAGIDVPLAVSVDRKTSKGWVVLQSSREVGGRGLKAALKRAVFGLLHPSAEEVDAAPEQQQKEEEEEEKSPKPNRSEVQRRRYTSHLVDVELAMEYALTHEIGQKKVIVGDGLEAAKGFVRALARHFPGPKTARPTEELLRRLLLWFDGREDAVRGEDVVEKVRELKAELGAMEGGGGYVGCTGSKPEYGGYPCGLWTLWHHLAANQMSGGGGENDDEVLKAMVGYVKGFFGCGECSDNFAKMAAENAADEVRSASDAAAWIWKAHNEVNVRLRGDVTDDPAFPKAAFPDRDHCPECYDGDGGFDVDRVTRFLSRMYRDGADNGMQPPPTQSKRSAAVAYERKRDLSDPNRTWFFSMADIGICVMLYLGSALLLVFICHKFFSWRRLLTALKRQLGGRDGAIASSRPYKMV